MRTAIVLLLLAGIASASEFQTLPETPRLKTRVTVSHVAPGDPFIGDANEVHNVPNVHRNWIKRHPRLFGVIVIGAGAGIGAGIARAQYRGVCTERYANGYTYVGTNPCPKD